MDVRVRVTVYRRYLYGQRAGKNTVGTSIKYLFAVYLISIYTSNGINASYGTYVQHYSYIGTVLKVLQSEYLTVYCNSMVPL